MKPKNAPGCESRCPVKAAIQLIGGKWKVPILFHLQEGTKRFNELKRLMSGATQRMSTKQLRELEADRIIKRKIFNEIYPKVEYSLTEFGLKLQPTSTVLREWGVERFEKLIKLRTHT